MHRARAAFTLVEVMVSVMIISVVIMALIEMHGNSTHLFTNIKKDLGLGTELMIIVTDKLDPETNSAFLNNFSKTTRL